MSNQTQTTSEFVGLSSRDAFGKVIVELGEKYENIVALSADLAGSVKLNDFIKKFPDRFVNFGVAEQNMMGSAAGLTLAGKVPFACTYAAFASMRACEQIRTDIAYNGLPVKIISSHGGITFGIAGATHQALEDIGILRGMPGMAVFSPADGVETAAILRVVMDIDGPVYVRLSRVKEKQVYTQDFDYQIGKPSLLVEGKDLLLIATGAEVGETLEAAQVLKEKGLDAGVLNISTIKPLDQAATARVIKDYPAAMTVEQHNILNGLGSLVSEVIAENDLPVKFRRHGLMDHFTTSGPYSELLSYYQLDGNGIADTVLKFID